MRRLATSLLVKSYIICHSVLFFVFFVFFVFFFVVFFLLYTEVPISIIGHVQMQGWKTPLQALRDERVDLLLPCISVGGDVITLFHKYTLLQQSSVFVLCITSSGCHLITGSQKTLAYLVIRMGTEHHKNMPL